MRGKPYGEILETIHFKIEESASISNLKRDSEKMFQQIADSVMIIVVGGDEVGMLLDRGLCVCDRTA